MLQKLLIIVSLSLLVFAWSCSSTNETKNAAKKAAVEANVTTEETDKKFEGLANQFIAEFLEMNPESATRLGEHKYDTELNDYSLEGVKTSIENY